MSASMLVWLVVAAGLVGLGVYGVLVAGHLLRKLLALNLLGAAVFLLLIVLGSRTGSAPDPVTQAMVLTGIVIAVSATAFGLAMLVALYRRSGEASLDDDEALPDDADSRAGSDIRATTDTDTNTNTNHDRNNDRTNDTSDWHGVATTADAAINQTPTDDERR